MSRRTFWDEPRANVWRCAECGEKVASADEAGLESCCSRCGAELHSCRNCTFFDTSAEKECRQPVEVRVAKKRENNSCPLFKPQLAVDLRGDTASKDDEARRAWDSLFK